MTIQSLQDQICSRIDIVMSVVGAVLGIAAGCAVGISWLETFSKPDNADVGGYLFTLAQVMAIFGGFGFVAGFSKYGDGEFRLQLRRAGALHLISALGFSLLGMILPFSNDEVVWANYGVVLYVPNIAAALMAIFGFGVGTFLWVSQLHKLLDPQNDADVNGDLYHQTPVPHQGDEAATTTPSPHAGKGRDGGTTKAPIRPRQEPPHSK